jgi:hypothetical protein
MGQGRSCASLVLEAPQAVGIDRQHDRQHFDRDGASSVVSRAR